MIKIGHSELFLIRKGPPPWRKKQIALRIFIEVSLGFEHLQESWPFSWITNSGFSADDLVSNLIAFYRAVEGYTWQHVLDECEQTSTEAARTTYDATFREGGIEARKVREFFKPVLPPAMNARMAQSSRGCSAL